MARLNINIGTTANDKTGDPLRTAFNKVNQNFIELYSHLSTDVQIPSQTGNANKYLTTNGTTLRWDDLSNSIYAGGPGGLRWEFEELSDDEGETYYGRINFPDGSSQYTAWPGSVDRLVNGSKEVVLGAGGILILPNDGTINNVVVPGEITGGGATVNLVPNQLGQTTSLLTVDKLGPPNGSWAVPQIGWTVTVNSTTATITNVTSDSNNAYFTLNNSVTLPITGSVTFTEAGTQAPDTLKIEIAPDGVTTWSFGSDGVLTSPNGSTQQGIGSVNCQPSVDTVVYTSSQEGIQTIKLLLKVEGTVTGNVADTQSCEMIIAKGFRGPTVAASVYGIVYTSVAPLATFTAQWNPTTSRVEVTCQPTSLTNSVTVKAVVTEITTSD